VDRGGRSPRDLGAGAGGEGASGLSLFGPPFLEGRALSDLAAVGRCRPCLSCLAPSSSSPVPQHPPRGLKCVVLCDLFGEGGYF
jgi:hypothetical protein